MASKVYMRIHTLSSRLRVVTKSQPKSDEFRLTQFEVVDYTFFSLNEVMPSMSEYISIIAAI